MFFHLFWTYGKIESREDGMDLAPRNLTSAGLCGKRKAGEGRPAGDDVLSVPAASVRFSRRNAMSTTVFLLVFIALGFAFLAYFNQRSKNAAKRRPGEKNPIDFWLYGKDRTDDDDD
jgi:hypothetical protein